MDMLRIFRFAPSPNGPLHLGHAYSALLNADMAASCGGRLLLRMEDIDLGRARSEYEQGICDDLAWLGLHWETPMLRQSERFDIYASALERLGERGLVYPCFCSRLEVARVTDALPDWPRDPDGSPIYPGTCRHLAPQERDRRLASGAHAALRLDMPAALAECGTLLGWREFGLGQEGRDVRAEPAMWGDVVLGRKDVPASYHLAVVVDDAAQKVTDVVRGEDLFFATSLHRLLQSLLDFDAPDYRHHPLVRDAEGRKLLKSQGSKSLADWRREGASPQDVRRIVGLAEGMRTTAQPA